MADSTVGALTAASALTGTELFYGVQAANDVKVTAAQIATFTGGGGGGGMAIGGTVTGATLGSVLFAGTAGVLSQDNANFYFDDALNDLHIAGRYYIGATDKAVYMVPNGSGNNWFEGNAGNTSVSGYQNFATGDLALSSLTSGHQNTAMGANALRLASTASGNVAIGTSALFSVSSGQNNFAIGIAAGQQITTGQSNFCVGNSALQAVITGVGNTAVGNSVLQTLGTGDGNTAIGLNGATNLSSGYYNIFIGNNTGGSLTSGDYNTMIGSYAASFYTGSATGSLHLGFYSGLNITTSNRNTLVGSWTGPSAGVSDVIAISTGFDSGIGSGVLRADFGYSNSGWTFVATSKAGAPAAGDLPSGTFAVIDDTSANQTWLVFNKSGTIRKVQLT